MILSLFTYVIDRENGDRQKEYESLYLSLF